MKKDLKAKAQQASEQLTSVSEDSEKAFSDAQLKGKRKKSQGDYIRLDLRPTNGKDLKAYVTRQAGKESGKRKEIISVTRYIQELIEKDMVKNSGRRTKADELKDKIDLMNKKQLKLFSDLFENLGL